MRWPLVWRSELERLELWGEGYRTEAADRRAERDRLNEEVAALKTQLDQVPGTYADGYRALHESLRATIADLKTANHRLRAKLGHARRGRAKQKGGAS